MDKEVVKIEIDKNLKNKVDGIFEKLGLTTEVAINIFLNKVIISNGMPFSVTANAEKSERREGGREGGDRRGGDRGRGGFSARGRGFGGGDRGGDRRGDRGGDRGDRRGGKSSGGDFGRRGDSKSGDRPRTERKKLTLNNND